MKYRSVIPILCLFISGPGVAFAQDLTLTGTRTLDKDTVISADTMTFKSDAVVLTNGFKLTLQAKKSIVVEGTPSIVAFEARSSRPPGDAGRSAGPIIIDSPALAGNILKIADIGEDGVNGVDGTTGPAGPNGRQGTQRDWNPWNGCIGGSNGTPGGQGGDGGNGGVGGNGGAGGTIVINIKHGFTPSGTPRLDMTVTGGKAGTAGAPGAGGAGGHGGLGAPGTATCGGTDAGPGGPQGRSGLAGVSGASGNAGLIIDLNRNTLPANLTEREKAMHVLGFVR
jgi:hypothetical protein